VTESYTPNAGAAKSISQASSACIKAHFVLHAVHHWHFKLPCTKSSPTRDPKLPSIQSNCFTVLSRSNLSDLPSSRKARAAQASTNRLTFRTEKAQRQISDLHNFLVDTRSLTAVHIEKMPAAGYMKTLQPDFDKNENEFNKEAWRPFACTANMLWKDTKVFADSAGGAFY